jgi:hypothetical protein
MRSSNIFIFGLPRSGTTWLGKIFDSHPDILLRHEPDTVNPTNAFPFVMHSSEIDSHLVPAKNYLLDRIQDRQLRCVSSTPYFNKSYRDSLSESIRRYLIVTARALDTLSRGNLERKITIPDMISTQKSVRRVVKSVDSVGRVPLFAKACPNEKFIYIVRHPCGVAGSKIRGRSLGKIGSGSKFSDWLKFDYAVDNKFSEADLERWSILESGAWAWTMTNDFVIKMAKNLPNLEIIYYDALCENPIEQSKVLFDHANLDWSSQTEKYINKCVSSDPGRKVDYYSTQQNPLHAANRWKSELSKDDIEAIMAICKQSENCMNLMSA